MSEDGKFFYYVSLVLIIGTFFAAVAIAAHWDNRLVLDLLP